MACFSGGQQERAVDTILLLLFSQRPVYFEVAYLESVKVEMSTVIIQVGNQWDSGYMFSKVLSEMSFLCRHCFSICVGRTLFTHGDLNKMFIRIYLLNGCCLWSSSENMCHKNTCTSRRYFSERKGKEKTNIKSKAKQGVELMPISMGWVGISW